MIYKGIKVMLKLNRAAGGVRLLKLAVYLLVLLSAQPGLVIAADLDKGKSLYLVHCSGCHGEKGFSVMAEVPNFARGEGLGQPDPVLMDAVRTGGDRRPPFLGILNDREILDVISYVRTLL